MPFSRLIDIPWFKILVVIVSFFFSIVPPRPVWLHTGIRELVVSQNHPIFVLNPIQIKAWNPLKDIPTTQPRSSQNREGPASFRFSRLARPRVIAPLLWCCTASLLQCCAASLLHCFDASMLHRFDASMLRRFIASLLRRFRNQF